LGPAHVEQLKSETATLPKREFGHRDDAHGKASYRASWNANPAAAQAPSRAITPTLKRNSATAAVTAMAAEKNSKRPPKPCGQSTW